MILVLAAAALADPNLGYYREPTLHGDTVVFVSQGDLWTVPRAGGAAVRLTTHPAAESSPKLSPDGLRVAFAASYEGPTETYVMPLAGGPPTRLSWVGVGASPVGWTPEGDVVVATRATSDLPSTRLAIVDPATAAWTPIPLAEAAQATWSPDGALIFTRLSAQGSHTKRYQGGTAQDIWRWDGGDAEAVELTGDWAGTSREPLWWDGRVLFVSDRDGTMNLWSMKPDGTDLKQLTKHAGFDVSSPSVSDGHVVYRVGADLWDLDLQTGKTAAIPVTIGGDADLVRERWITNPWSWVTSAHVSANGDAVVLTARGQAFVVPYPQGRLVDLDRPGVRLRDARFTDPTHLVALSDESHEVELWSFAANGVGDPKQLTTDGTILRWTTAPSPDGRYIAHNDKNMKLWLTDTKAGTTVLIDTSDVADFADLSWSADSRWLAYTRVASNLKAQVRLYDTADGTAVDASTDRYDTYSPVFSPDGHWLYAISDRHFETVVESPWGGVWNDPFFDAPGRIFAIALRDGLRSPFEPVDELHPADAVDVLPEDEDDKPRRTKKHRQEPPKTPPPVRVDAVGLASRLVSVPLPPGNLSRLSVGEKRLFWLERSATVEPTFDLMTADIGRKDVEPLELVAGVTGYELSADKSTLLVMKESGAYILDAGAPPGADLGDAQLDLSGWKLSVNPRLEWAQMFDEAWRLERDYFYDPGMHGVDWQAMHDKYRPLVDRVGDRAELSDLVAQMVSELSALHIFVYGGDFRGGPDHIAPASLGASLVRDEAAGGWRVAAIPAFDPDRPDDRPPLAVPGHEVRVGEVITAIDGASTLDVADPSALLRGKAGQQVLLHVRGALPDRKKPVAPERDVIVVPVDPGTAADERYTAWELTRRQRVETLGDGKIGYVHLRAMGAEDIAAWTEAYLPVFDREALIVDVRHNGGGNIDSWILRRLAVKPWMYWSQRVGASPTWNPQYGFRGHLIVLCDARTGSDGEAFTEGFRRLGLGQVVGTRTWGGEIWLSSSNFLVDGGIATAAEYGVFGPEGTWLVEGHGVDPDVVVDDLPHATYAGEDAQLDTAVKLLLDQLAKEPVEDPPQPKWPDKSK
jgi:tricorn protease